MVSSSQVISMENMAAFLPCAAAAFIMWRESAVFPTEGRAATMTRFPGAIPPYRTSSTLEIPVVVRLGLPSILSSSRRPISSARRLMASTRRTSRFALVGSSWETTSAARE